MAYVPVPKDLSKVKNKVFLNLTARQIVCFALAGIVGIPFYFLTKGIIGTDVSASVMVLLMLPFFFFALYEKGGLPLEKIIANYIRTKFKNPKIRPYKTENLYQYLVDEGKKEEERLIEKKKRKKTNVKQKNRKSAAFSTGKPPGTKAQQREKKRVFHPRNIPRTAQQSIPYKAMYRDGICKVTANYFSITIAYEDINYQLAQNEDKVSIFENYCDFLNYYDSTISVQLTFFNSHANLEAFTKNILIPLQEDGFDGIRKEYSTILEGQMNKGNNGLEKLKFVTLGIEAKSIRTARARLERIAADSINNFKVLGVKSKILTGRERLEVLYRILNEEYKEPFHFGYHMLAESGLSTKDFVAPSSMGFGEKRTFQLGDMNCSTSYLQILAPELTDRMLAEFLNVEDNITINIHLQSMDQAEAIKMIKRKLSDIDKMKIEEQKKAVRNGYDMEIIPSDLVTYGSEAKNMLEELQNRNERMFLVTLVFMSMDKHKKKLENMLFQARGIAQKYNCMLRPLDYQQEEGFVSSLPIGLNKIEIRRALTTSATAIFVPFTTQELFQDGEALYYGLNALSNNLIMVDRKRLKNPNGLFLGTPGSGKSFSAKREIVNCFLITRDDIIISDPEGEYAPLVTMLKGQVVKISSTSTQYINPMDINLNYSEDDNPIKLKSEFIFSICELIAGGKEGLAGDEISIIDQAVREVYEEYLLHPIPEKMPILGDLYEILKKNENPKAKRIATCLDIYVNGSLNIFNHRTNVDIQNRMVCFDIKELGKQLKKIGMLVVQDQVWNRVTINRQQKKATRFYQDEFHLMLKEEQTASYSVEIWKRFRKWGGIPTGITQNVKDLLASREIENIFENSDFIYMLNQASGDRKILAKALNISPHQLSYVTNSAEGEGLLYYGNVIIPFIDHFPADTNLYRIMTTRLSEISDNFVY